MIKKISISNFQSHKNTSLELSPKINVIVGLSQSGKTAILRSINWVLTNRPTGFRFNHKDTGRTSVQIDTTEGGQVTLTKDPSGASYSVNKTLFSTVGVNVPDQVQKVLNLTELNIQNQLDQPFLITSSPGEVARVFNQVTKTEQVDEWVSELTSRINDGNKKIRFYKEQIDKTNTDLKKLEGLDNVKVIFQRLDECEGTIVQNSADIKRITEIKNILISSRDKQSRCRSILESEKILEEIEEIENSSKRLHEEADVCSFIKDRRTQISNISDFLGKGNQLAFLCDSIENKINLLSKEKNLLETLNIFRIKISSYQQEINYVKGILSVFEDMENKSTVLFKERTNLRLFKQSKQDLVSKKDYLNKTKAVYVDKIQKLGICPVCGSSTEGLDEETILGVI